MLHAGGRQIAINDLYRTTFIPLPFLMSFNLSCCGCSTYFCYHCYVIQLFLTSFIPSLAGDSESLERLCLLLS